MYSFEVRGGKKLSGDITPQGAKNEALQIISAVLLTPEKVTVSNIPDIIDVNLLIELLGEMNVKVERPHLERRGRSCESAPAARAVGPRAPDRAGPARSVDSCFHSVSAPWRPLRLRGP